MILSMVLPEMFQEAFARKMLALIDSTTDPNQLRQLYELTEMFKAWHGSEDSILLFDLGEYAYETYRIAAGEETDDGWKKEARKNLDEALKDDERAFEEVDQRNQQEENRHSRDAK